eukprot:5587925-Pleurochrysis_carterae.AAC.3
MPRARVHTAASAAAARGVDDGAATPLLRRDERRARVRTHEVQTELETSRLQKIKPKETEHARS